MKSKVLTVIRKLPGSLFQKGFAAFLFAMVGVYLLQSSHAATISISAESEAGTHTGAAQVIADLSASGGSATSFGATGIYVSPTGLDTNPGTLSAPFATPAKARDFVRTQNANMSKDIVVYLRGGTYNIANTVTYGASDSGTNGHNIIYKNYAGEVPVLSGGKSITGWTLSDSSKNIWKATVSAGFNTRQLYVDGARAQRARGVDDPAGFTKTSTGFTTTDTNLQNWGNKTDIEFTGYSAWKLFRCSAASITGTAITLKDPCWRNSQITNDAWTFKSVKFIENAYELLDSGGEWYLNRATSTLYYKPRTGENMSTAKVIAPTTETLVQGTSVHHVQFQGLTFAYAGWMLPSGNDGYAGLQNAIHFEGNPEHLVKIPGNVTFQSSHDIRFERNVFARLGGSGLVFDTGSQNTTVLGNRFEDISGSGVMYGDIGDQAQTDVTRQSRLHTFKDNYVTKIGQEYYDAAGVFSGYADSLSITNNELYDIPQSGVAMGWGWGAASYAKNNFVSKNYIHEFTKVLYDSAAVYLLSPQPNTVISYNHVDHGWLLYGCIYPDQGTAYTNWHHNVCKRVNQWLHIWTTSIHDNTVQYNYSDTTSSINNGTNNTVNNNTTITNGVWPAEAQSIMNNAGIEPAYLYVKTMPLP